MALPEMNNRPPRAGPLSREKKKERERERKKENERKEENDETGETVTMEEIAPQWSYSNQGRNMEFHCNLF